jgi:hypothetical protein
MASMRCTKYEQVPISASLFLRPNCKGSMLLGRFGQEVSSSECVSRQIDVRFGKVMNDILGLT